ncbi:MAG: TonB-dependent receptor [Bryobacterales bacterium]|nr:TonB-dependent receptor [Bryobacterales bacterium]
MVNLGSAARLLSLVWVATAAWADLAVQVVDPSGAVVQDAVVVLRDQSGSEVARGATAASGVAEFTEHAATVDVAAEGFRAETVSTAGHQEVTVRLQLAPVAGALDVVDEFDPIAPVASDSAEPDRLARVGLVESLRSTPHVHVLRRGGTNFEPVVQGLRETQLAMVVDGTRTFAAGPARMDSELSHVDPNSVAEVEVVTGPYALTEGAGAMAAILVRSEPIPARQNWRAGGRGGIGWRSNGAGRMANARIDAGNSRLGFSLRATGDLLDDYEAGASGRAIAALVPGDAASHQFATKLRFNPTPQQEFQVGGLYDEQTGVDYPGRLLTAEHFLLRSWQASYRAANPEGAISSVKLGAYVNKKSHRMSNREKPTAMDMPGRRPPFALDVSLPAESDTVGANGRVEFSPGEQWQLQAGFDFFRLEQDAQRFIARASNRKLIFSDAVWAGVSLADIGTYFHAGRSFDRGEVRAAVRLDFVTSDAGRPSEFFLANTSAEVRRSETNANFSLAGRYDVGHGFTIAGGVGRVARTANALERYSDRFPSTRFQVAAEFMGDPAIRPESSLQGDLNVEWQAGKFRISAGGYVRSLGDYITVTPVRGLNKRLPLSPPVVFRYVNGECAFFRGWSLGVRRTSDRFEFRFQASKTIADDRELMEPVLGIAPMEIDSAARFVAPGRRVWAEYGIRNVWDQRRVSAVRLESPSPGFALHGFRFGADLWDGSTLHFGIENAGDKYYYEHLNSLNPFTGQRIPEIGRAVTVGFTTIW